MDKIIIIGARSGSKRVPNKNLKLLGNEPLINWSILCAKVVLRYDTYVSSDSDEILDIVRKESTEFRKIIPIKRPSELASDISTDLDWIKHLLEEYYKVKKEYPEKLIFLRPTTPIRDHRIVREAIKKFDEHESFSSLSSLEPISEAIEKTFRLKKDNIVIPAYPNISMEETNNPNQMFPQTYKANGYVDILKTENILKNNSLYGNKIFGFITPKTVDIDDIEDFQYAEFLLNRKAI